MTIRRNPDARCMCEEIDLISAKELKAIRNIWLKEKHEIEDFLPRIVETVTGTGYAELIEEAPVVDPGALKFWKRPQAVIDFTTKPYATTRHRIPVSERRERRRAARIV